MDFFLFYFIVLANNVFLSYNINCYAGAVMVARGDFMLAKDLYAQVDRDFLYPELRDDYTDFIAAMRAIKVINEYITQSFRTRSMGLLFDFAEEVHKVYTAVFPSENVLKKVLALAKKHKKGCMLLLHHPLDWSYKDEKLDWLQIAPKWLEKCRKAQIAIYIMNTPLDNYGKYSTGRTFAEVVGITAVEPFVEYMGGMVGIIGRTRCKTLQELSDVFCSAIGHAPQIYPYGSEIIRDGMVAVMPGGGQDTNISPNVSARGINTLIVGVSNKSYLSNHCFEQTKGINIIGGTRYSTEKFACISICNYFRKLGVPASFIEDSPTLEDM